MQLSKKVFKLQRNFLMRLLIGSTTLIVSLGAYSSYQVVRHVMLESLKKNAFLEVQQGRDDLEHWLTTLKVHTETVANTATVKSMDVAEFEYESVGSNLSGTPPKSPTSEGL